MNKYIFKEDYVIGYTQNTNEEFYIDIDVYEYIKNFPWKESSDGYIVTGQLTLHRFIIGLTTDLDTVEIIDHKNRNRKDNRHKNLRLTSHKNNIRNSSKRESNKTGIIGVCKKYQTSKGVCYRATIDVDRQKIELCCSYNIEDCIIARLKAEHEYYGEFAPQRHLFNKYNIA